MKNIKELLKKFKINIDKKDLLLLEQNKFNPTSIPPKFNTDKVDPFSANLAFDTIDPYLCIDPSGFQTSTQVQNGGTPQSHNMADPGTDADGGNYIRYSEQSGGNDNPFPADLSGWDNGICGENSVQTYTYQPTNTEYEVGVVNADSMYSGLVALGYYDFMGTGQFVGGCAGVEAVCNSSTNPDYDCFISFIEFNILLNELGVHPDPTAVDNLPNLNCADPDLPCLTNPLDIDSYYTNEFGLNGVAYQCCPNPPCYQDGCADDTSIACEDDENLIPPFCYEVGNDGYTNTYNALPDPDNVSQCSYPAIGCTLTNACNYNTNAEGCDTNEDGQPEVGNTSCCEIIGDNYLMGDNGVITLFLEYRNTPANFDPPQDYQAQQELTLETASEWGPTFFDCEGNCLLETDCMGVCGGNAPNDSGTGGCGCGYNPAEEGFDCDGDPLDENMIQVCTNPDSVNYGCANGSYYETAGEMGSGDDCYTEEELINNVFLTSGGTCYIEGCNPPLLNATGIPHYNTDEELISIGTVMSNGDVHYYLEGEEDQNPYTSNIYPGGLSLGGYYDGCMGENGQLSPENMECCIWEGCNNPNACNYNSMADEQATEISQFGNGELCNYPPNNYDCNGNCIADVDCNGVCGGSAEEDVCGECGGDGPEEGYDCNGDPIGCYNVTARQCSPNLGTQIAQLITPPNDPPDGLEVVFECMTIDGDHPELPPASTLESQTQYNYEFIAPGYEYMGTVEGCTDPSFIEYDPNANLDDGSCQTLIVEGCTDDVASNYNPDANVEDGSCEYAISGVGCQSDHANANVDMTNIGNLQWMSQTETAYNNDIDNGYTVQVGSTGIPWDDNWQWGSQGICCDEWCCCNSTSTNYDPNCGCSNASGECGSDIPNWFEVGPDYGDGPISSAGTTTFHSWMWPNAAGKCCGHDTQVCEDASTNTYDGLDIMVEGVADCYYCPVGNSTWTSYTFNANDGYAGGNAGQVSCRRSNNPDGGGPDYCPNWGMFGGEPDNADFPNAPGVGGGGSGLCNQVPQGWGCPYGFSSFGGCCETPVAGGYWAHITDINANNACSYYVEGSHNPGVSGPHPGLQNIWDFRSCPQNAAPFPSPPGTAWDMPIDGFPDE
jgi:hypothetical protein